jgi:8-oxo-dGTP diphosphatase
MREAAVLQVVAALMFSRNEVLACRRAAHKASPGVWEFPGGKVEVGEDPFEALEREIQEELGLSCQAVQSFDVSETIVGAQVIRLNAIICSVNFKGELSSTDHDKFRWLALNQLDEVEWAKPDLSAVNKLRAIGSVSQLNIRYPGAV